MRKLLAALRRRLRHAHNGTAVPPAFELEDQIEAIRDAEAEAAVGLGKRIHQFRYLAFDVRLDRDVMGHYRVTIHEGTQRRYSFTIHCAQGDYEALRAGFVEIKTFLDGERRPLDLPSDEHVRGRYYGQG